MKATISVITPIYDQCDLIQTYIKNLKKQTYGFRYLEIILVNDGSSDDSDTVCQKFTYRYKNIRYFCNEHGGVSSARNTGIREATGKYVFFLDADDQLSDNTIEDCVCVFDSVYNEVDLLTYPIETYYKGRKLAPHFRYRFLKEDGVYDLTTEAFIGQTTMNIVIKNRFDNNILFDESMEFSEDQKYCCDVVRDKLKMGFCKTATYIYHRSEESASGRLAGACYVFESSMKMFEDIFAGYEHVPVAYQGLFVNDVYWKLIENILFPYHYDKERFDEAMARIKALLRRCYPYVILSHPNFDYYEKFYLMRLKGEDSIKLELKKNEIAMYSEGHDVFRRKDIEMVVTKLRIEGKKVRILGFLKSVFFQFYHGNIELYAIENEKSRKQMPLRPSVHNYYRSHEATQCFYATEYECDIEQVSTMRFELKLGSTILPVGYYIMPLVPFTKTEHIYRKKGVEIELQNKKWSFRKYKYTSDRQVWLYYDCRGVEIDNGLKQFLHDSCIMDDVERYYVYTDEKQLKHISWNAKKVAFGSGKHEQLLLSADKVITAFIENNNILPWPQTEYDSYSNRLHFDTIYLQHGVLHINMPWKYSPEKIIADKVVVSSNVDYELFRKNGYRDADLWKTGMPRFDGISLKNSKNGRILFAPSWRSYLVTADEEHGWRVLNTKFLLSRYYSGVKEFLEAEELHCLLKEQGYSLDVKLHPIFAKADLSLDVDRQYIRMVDKVEESDYDLFITDFSSYLFDFLYREIPVLSYIPDMDEFKCGMNGYRKVDFMDKVGDDAICKNASEIIGAIRRYFDTGEGMNYSVEFYNQEGSAVEGIYRRVSEM